MGAGLRWPGRIYLPLFWFIEGGVTDIARSTMQSILDMESLKHFPVAERIGVEFTAWGSVSMIVLLALTFIGLSILGKLVQGRAGEWLNRPADTLSGSDLALGYASCAGRSGVDVDGVYCGRSGAEHPLLVRASCVDAPSARMLQAIGSHRSCPTSIRRKSLSKGEKTLKDAELKIAALEHQAAEDEKDKAKGGKDKAGVKEGSAKNEGKASQSAAGKPAGSGK